MNTKTIVENIAKRYDVLVGRKNDPTDVYYLTKQYNDDIANLNYDITELLETTEGELALKESVSHSLSTGRIGSVYYAEDVEAELNWRITEGTK